MNYAMRKIIADGVERAGVDFVRAEHAGKHFKVYVRKDGIEKFITISGSTSDGWGEVHNIVKSIRKVFIT